MGNTTTHLFTWADYTIIAIVGLSAIVSLARGFVREALSLITWVVAFWVAFTFSGTLSDLLVNTIKMTSLRTIASFGILFVATLLLGAFINYLIGQLVDKTGLSGTDRVIGVLFGAGRGILLVTVLLLAAQLTPVTQDPWWKQSILIPYFQPLEIWLHGLLPKTVTEQLKLSY